MRGMLIRPLLQGLFWLKVSNGHRAKRGCAGGLLE